MIYGDLFTFDSILPTPHPKHTQYCGLNYDNCVLEEAIERYVWCFYTIQRLAAIEHRDWSKPKVDSSGCYGITRSRELKLIKT